MVPNFRCSVYSLTIHSLSSLTKKKKIKCEYIISLLMSSHLSCVQNKIRSPPHTLDMMVTP